MNQEDKIAQLEKQVADLEFFIKNGDNNYEELSEKYYELEEKYDESLKDVYNFIRCCEQRNDLDKNKQLRWTQDQKDFLEEYLQFFNN